MEEMSEMVERVAKAICEASGGDDGVYRAEAVAAIEAMRVPTEAMIDGADDAFHAALRKHREYNERAGISPGAFASSPFSEAIWPAMIDAALSSSTRGE